MKKNKLTLLFAIFFTTLSMAQITKMEPPFWWSGMNNPDLQVMFYGKNIAEYQVSSEGKFVIKGITKTENPNYLFVTIDTKGVAAQEILFSFSKNKSNSSRFEELMIDNTLLFPFLP